MSLRAWVLYECLLISSYQKYQSRSEYQLVKKLKPYFYRILIAIFFWDCKTYLTIKYLIIYLVGENFPWSGFSLRFSRIKDNLVRGTSNWGSYVYPCRMVFSNLWPIFCLLHGLDYKTQNCKWTRRNGVFLEAHNQLPQNASQLISIFSHKQIRSHTYWTELLICLLCCLLDRSHSVSSSQLRLLEQVAFLAQNRLRSNHCVSSWLKLLEQSNQTFDNTKKLHEMAKSGTHSCLNVIHNVKSEVIFIYMLYRIVLYIVKYTNFL